MGMSRQKREQKARLKYFPIDRIPFYAYSLDKDTSQLAAYKNRKITLDELRENIARNNYLDKEDITELRIMTLLRFTGWEQKHEV
jgi:hypothetical protein